MGWRATRAGETAGAQHATRSDRHGALEITRGTQELQNTEQEQHARASRPVEARAWLAIRCTAASKAPGVERGAPTSRHWQPLQAPKQAAPRERIPGPQALHRVCVVPCSPRSICSRRQCARGASSLHSRRQAPAAVSSLLAATDRARIHRSAHDPSHCSPRVAQLGARTARGRGARCRRCATHMTP